MKKVEISSESPPFDEASTLCRLPFYMIGSDGNIVKDIARHCYLMPYALLMIIFDLTNRYLFIQPMAMRW